MSALSSASLLSIFSISSSSSSLAAVAASSATEVAVYNKEDERGPKGTNPHTATPGGKARSSDGIFVRYAGSCYGVLSYSGSMLYPPAVTPINEMELVARGLPRSGTDVGTQVGGGDLAASAAFAFARDGFMPTSSPAPIAPPLSLA